MIESLRQRIRENELLYLFVTNRVAQVAALVAMLSIGGAALAPIIAPTNPYDIASIDIMDSLVPPMWSDEGEARFVIGTDDQGRDLFSAILYGTRLSLLVGLLSVGFASVLGVTVGLMAGYFGGRFDAIVMRIADVQLSLPAILTALLIDGIARGILPRDKHDGLMIVVLTIAIGLSLWVNFARTVRASTMVEILVILTVDLAVAVLLEATLSFLGIGVPANQPSLGTLIRIGTEYMFSGEWWIVVFPSAMLITMIVAINVLGDFLRDAFNPRLR